ncbi:MAG: AAA family ATPase [Taibaiella sp.]|jgi:ATP-dependent exoDNAse (exonuclease V) alpha subunit
MNKINFSDNIQAQACYDLATGSQESILCIGGAGVGKSTLIRAINESPVGNNTITLAHTGVAAMNVGGWTISSMFGMPIGKLIFSDQVEKNLKLLYFSEQKHDVLANGIDIIIIDEISMVSSRTLDIIDVVLKGIKCREKPFGGYQMIFVGDPMQLPPIENENEHPEYKKRYKSEYFFDSHAFQKLNPLVINLEKVYRQEDTEFVNCLNNIRIGMDVENSLKIINSKTKKQ